MKSIVACLVLMAVTGGVAGAQEETPKWQGFMTFGGGISNFRIENGERQLQLLSKSAEVGLALKLTERWQMNLGVGILSFREKELYKYVDCPVGVDYRTLPFLMNYTNEYLLTFPVTMQFGIFERPGRFGLFLETGFSTGFSALISEKRGVMGKPETHTNSVCFVGDDFEWNITPVVKMGFEALLAGGRSFVVAPAWLVNGKIDQNFSLVRYRDIPNQLLLTGTYKFGVRKGKG